MGPITRGASFTRGAFHSLWFWALEVGGGGLIGLLFGAVAGIAAPFICLGGVAVYGCIHDLLRPEDRGPFLSLFALVTIHALVLVARSDWHGPTLQDVINRQAAVEDSVTALQEENAEQNAAIQRLQRQITAATAANRDRLNADYPLGWVVYATDGTRLDHEIGRRFPGLLFSPAMSVLELTDSEVRVTLPNFAIVGSSGSVTQVYGSVSTNLSREVGWKAPLAGSGDVVMYAEVLRNTDFGVSWAIGFRRRPTEH